MRLKTKLLGYQVKGVKFAFKNYWTMIGDEQGLGKTVQALALIGAVESGKNIVVCPAMLKDTWQKEIEKFLPDMADSIEIISYAKFTARNHEKYDVLVFDEAHYLKNKDSKRTQKVWDLVVKEPPRYLLMLTGTPIKNHILEFYSPIMILSQCPFDSNGRKWQGGYYKFARHFTNHSVVFKFGRQMNIYEGAKNISELREYLRGKYIRRLAKNTLELPPLIRKEVWVNNPALDSKLDEAWLDYKGGGSFPTLKAECATRKARHTVEYVDSLLVEGPVVVYSDHRQPVLDIMEGLTGKGHRVGIILGGTTEKQRNLYINDFKEGRIQVLVMTIGAASTGLTLIRSNHMVFNDYPWVPADLQQAEKRIHRIGQIKTAFIHYILIGEMDQKILGVVTEKAKLLGEVGNGTQLKTEA